MGDRLTEEEQSKQTSQTPYGDMFDKLLPEYMAMGMTYDEYWDGEYGTKRACLKAYRIRMENEQRIADRNNWYMGQYIVAAIQSVPLIVPGINMKKGASLPDYPDKPFFMRYEEQKKEEVRKQHEEDQSRLAMAMFQAMTAKFNKNIQNRLERQAQEGTGQ